MKLTIQDETTSAPTQFARARGVTYAYRKFGAEEGVPLLCLQHFTGTLDNWDPAVTGELAGTRPVILFDNAGIGRSTGTVPGTIDSMAEHAVQFMETLGLTQVDLLGFSLGGMVAQVLALEIPNRLRRIVLAGTGPKGGPGVAMDRPELLAIFTDQQMAMSEKLLALFFPRDAKGQAAGRAFLDRLGQRKTDLEPATKEEGAAAQLTAMKHWAGYGQDALAELRRISHPVLVTNGNNDIMIPTVNSVLLSENLPEAQLVLYPHSGHGALFQYPSTFVSHVREFLDRVTP